MLEAMRCPLKLLCARSQNPLLRLAQNNDNSQFTKEQQLFYPPLAGRHDTRRSSLSIFNLLFFWHSKPLMGSILQHYAVRTIVPGPGCVQELKKPKPFAELLVHISYSLAEAKDNHKDA